ncbi:MAG: PIN domain-containing protein [Aquabacterium sp.]|uniref:PIN domain-containing protein n=1 Tax=Aquabacterium sp. TaxID=1872578 RepID=UPI0012058427|nr:PIN domain-containing protein [Aquabacterium sp.]TAK86635.1 MAG: PIN domain-containing protein [Aquabacterium sp.]
MSDAPPVRAETPASTLPIVILDTNALLDWRVFKDPTAHPIAQAILEGRMRWIASPSMEQEWHQVWPRSYLKAWLPDPMLTLTVFQHAEFVDEPPRGPFRCKDPDDQVFIDLALHVGATWLFSKDAALLKLARRARTRGVNVMSLQTYAATQNAQRASPAGDTPDAASSDKA